MNSKKCGSGNIYEVPMKDIKYIGYFYGTNGSESIKTAYARVKKIKGAPDFFMNAELFDFDTRKAASDVVCGGKTHRLSQSYGIAFVGNKKPVFSYNNNVGAPDYVGAYPVLVREGKKETSEPAGIGGSRGRTALGLNKDTLYIALIPDGKNDVSLGTLRQSMILAGATDAINLDGGGSTQFYAPLGNHFTGRKVRGFIGVWLNHSTDIRRVSVRTSLNIRSGPGIFNKVIGKLYNGDTVTVLETKGTWCRISTGWVSAAYLKK